MKVNVSLRNILCITTMGFLQLFLPTICKNSFNKNAIAKFTPVFKLLLNIDCWLLLLLFGKLLLNIDC